VLTWSPAKERSVHGEPHDIFREELDEAVSALVTAACRKQPQLVDDYQQDEADTAIKTPEYKASLTISYDHVATSALTQIQ
jgi:hypothetical protein